MTVYTNDLPLVSIIVPSFNHEKFIIECIESIAGQTYSNFELIVIDDGSQDGSRSLLEDLKSKYDFKLIFQENHGIAHTLNRGIKDFAKGKYITFCASDDYWMPDKLEKQVNFMEKNRFYPMCYGKSRLVNEDSNVIDNAEPFERYLRGGWLFEDILTFKIHPHVNYLFHSWIFRETGLYDETVVAEDYHMNLLISSKYSIGFIDDYIAYYRITDTPSKIKRFDKISDSHLKTIACYSTHPLYKKARNLVFLRRFYIFSGYYEHKYLALLNIIGALPLFYHKRFLKGVIKLLIYWKKP